MNGTVRTLYLHIGLPKTASTFLQTRIFPELTHLRVFSTPRDAVLGTHDGQPSDRLFAEAFGRSSKIWPDYGDRIFERLLGDREIWRRGGTDVLISEEGIGRSGSRPALLAAHLDAFGQLARGWGFDRLAVLCLVRRQDHWLASHYAQLSDRRPDSSQADFEKLARTIVDPAGGRHALGALLDYAALRTHLLSVLEPDDLLFVPFELLSVAPRTFFARCLDHLGCPPSLRDALSDRWAERRENARSQTSGTWRLRRRRIRLVQRGPSLPLPLPRNRREIALTPEISRLLLEAYAGGNRDLADAADLDLGRLGYFVSGDTA